MKEISLDPRMNRIDLPEESHTTILDAKDSWITYEVFHQKKSGTQHTHAGIVHAPNAEMAMVFAKEQFARRGQTSGLWVVKSSEILSTTSEDAEIFATTPEKLHREASAYKSRDKIEKYRAEHE
ncbi:MAG: 1,2-phenylacetyl-CoA epoxidase subunit PaaB [Bacteroidia bacterium]